MSILEKDILDGVAISKKDNNLILFLSDELDFKDEYNHLLLLQDKINSYIAYIETEQYKEEYPDYLFNDIIVEIHFKYEPTNNCKHFIEVVNSIIEKYNMKCVIK